MGNYRICGQSAREENKNLKLCQSQHSGQAEPTPAVCGEESRRAGSSEPRQEPRATMGTPRSLLVLTIPGRARGRVMAGGAGGAVLP